MDGCGRIAISPFRAELERWRFVGGGVDRNGNILKEPWQLTRAKFIDNLCQRYGCLPSQLLAEDADLLLQMHAVLVLSGEHDSQSERSTATENPMEQSLANMSGLN